MEKMKEEKVSKRNEKYERFKKYYLGLSYNSKFKIYLYVEKFIKEFKQGSFLSLCDIGCPPITRDCNYSGICYCLFPISEYIHCIQFYVTPKGLYQFVLYLRRMMKRDGLYF